MVRLGLRWILVIMAMTLAACGGGGSNGTTSTGTNGTPQETTSALASVPASVSLSSVSVDTAGNMALAGTNNGDAYLTRLSSQGTALAGWPKTIANVTVKKIASSANYYAVLYSNAANSVLLAVYSAAGAVVVPETSIGTNVEAGDVALDGTDIYVSIVKTNGPTGNTVFKSTLTGNAPRLQVTTPMASKKLAVQSDGLWVAGDNTVVKYSKDLSATQNTITWSTGINPVIIDLYAGADGMTYAAGMANGAMNIEAYRSTGQLLFSKSYSTMIMDGTKKVRLGQNSFNELCFSLTGKFGKVDRISTEAFICVFCSTSFCCSSCK